ncbi:MAG: DUF3489 domain-containing protein [Aquabacterium sp.]|nr:DUF3489 domain-containing protein [Aquabacterium sp.]
MRGLSRYTPHSARPAIVGAIAAPAAAPRWRGTKQNIVLALPRRQQGASIAEIMEATGWQAHSVRGFMSGALKKRLRIPVVSDKDETGARRYRVAPLKTSS